uniref:Uncharacterized protein n=1 Tax=Utricularia reniformis TaxID=192314 RepID=A0A1Y0B193_9LAMI|nr:hypothetical protein AEK19_MT0904 [Utricularia reniformis]ART31133.1 hypothetical protein AEK19_MT0904 [Utricularia reniformis]
MSFPSAASNLPHASCDQTTSLFISRVLNRASYFWDSYFTRRRLELLSDLGL